MSAACVIAQAPFSHAAPKAPEVELTADGKALESKYAALLASLKADIEKGLPVIQERQQTMLLEVRSALKNAEAQAATAQQSLAAAATAKALVAHAKGKWIGGAEKGIAKAQQDLQKATTDAAREAAKKDLAKWQADKEAGVKELAVREQALQKAMTEQPKFLAENEKAQAALAKAREKESAARTELLKTVTPVLTQSSKDLSLSKAMILSSATPRGLAVYAQQGNAQRSNLEALFGNQLFMQQMLEAGGAKFHQYGRAIDIYQTIQKTSAKAREGSLQKLALAVALEHAQPVEQINAKNDTNAPKFIDPVKRYLHYEKAFLAGELDPAFKSFNAWEYRLVVACDAPDEILAWGREMLRNYRPDHITNPDYGWRYVSSVRTDVPYGSQNVQYDDPALQNYQNIIMNGGVCGRRAFFGRFILRSFGIPTWGVTQKAHAALSHWTPKGWVVNLGAGYEHSWWDKDEAPRSGVDFLLETQARAHGDEYSKVLRAKWISHILGEEQFNDRAKKQGGMWSVIAHYQATMLAASATTLGPLGQELAEANESRAKQLAQSVKAEAGSEKIDVASDGMITIPVVAGKLSGPSTAINALDGGKLVHASGGFKAEYAVKAKTNGAYALIVDVATLQKGQKIRLVVNDAAPQEIDVPYTIGMWKPTPATTVQLKDGDNVIRMELVTGSKGVSIKKTMLKATR